MSQPEHRRAARFIRAFVVRYQAFGAKSDAWLTSTLRNFSSVGARFLSGQPFRMGETIVLQLLLPTSRQPIVLKARVVWNKPGSLGSMDIGVEFEPTELAARKAISDAAQFFLRKQREAS